MASTSHPDPYLRPGRWATPKELQSPYRNAPVPGLGEGEVLASSLPRRPQVRPALLPQFLTFLLESLPGAKSDREQGTLVEDYCSCEVLGDNGLGVDHTYDFTYKTKLLQISRQTTEEPIPHVGPF